MDSVRERSPKTGRFHVNAHFQMLLHLLGRKGEVLGHSGAGGLEPA